MTFSPAARATAGLGFTQIVGWGTTFLMPAVLGRHMQDSLGLASEVVFAGITVMFGVGALLAPQVGRLIDRTGARTLMASGSALYAVSLAALAFSQGLVSYLLCWAAMGIASHLALSTHPALPSRRSRGGRAARHRHAGHHRGFASTVFWPLSGALESPWAGAAPWVYAAIHLFACLTVSVCCAAAPAAGAHLAAAANPARAACRRGAPPSLPAPVGDALKRRLRVHRAMVHMIELMRGLGHPAASACSWPRDRPAQVTVRVFELLFGHRYSIMNSAVFGSAALVWGWARHDRRQQLRHGARRIVPPALPTG